MKDILAGDMCCMDISAAGGGWNSSNANWGKKCCDPSNGYPVIPPPKDVSEEKIPAINAQITNMVGMTDVSNYIKINFLTLIVIKVISDTIIYVNGKNIFL